MPSAISIGSIPESLLMTVGVGIPVPLRFDRLWAWFDASYVPGVAGGGNVSTWDDLSGRGENFIQTVDTNQPVLTLGAVNGLPAITFSTDAGSNPKYLTNSTTLVLPLTIYAVARRTTGNLGVYNGIFSNGGICDLGFEQTNQNAYMYAGLFVTLAAADAAFHVLSAELNGANSMIRANDTQATGDAGANAPDSVAYIGYLAAAPFAGDLAELIVYSDSQSSDEIETLTRYLLSKYGLST